MRIAFYGSSLLSSYWNGAATYYRGLLSDLARRGHRVTFYEPDAFDRQKHRDIEPPDWAEVRVYPATEEAVRSVIAEAARAVEVAQRLRDATPHHGGASVGAVEWVEDEALMQETADIIRETKRCAEFALDKVIASYAEIFDAMDDAYMQARGADIRDVGQRLQLAMQGVRDDRFEGMEDHVIVIAEDLAPSDTARMDLDHVDGFITQEGGATSHVAIMARSLGLPALVGIKGILELAQHGQLLAMDAASGEIVCEPDEQTQARFAQKLEQQKRERELLAEARRAALAGRRWRCHP